MTFSILDHVELDSASRAQCPSCLLDGKTKRNLAVSETGAYHCHRGCSPEDIRAALGQPKPVTVPAALAPAGKPAKSVTISAEQVELAHQKLATSSGPAKKWLHQRGIDDDIINHYQLGIVQVRIEKKRPWAIAIPMPAGGDKYHLKKRVAPWHEETTQLASYVPWKQYGIPAQLWFTHKPDDATETWICEGEWDAMLMGWMCRVADMTVAVATPTCGAGTVVPEQELAKCPGDRVLLWFDRNDEPTKSGKVPGRDGAIAYARALGDRGYIAQVPMPKNCTKAGWDVTDAILNGYVEHDFDQAADAAERPPTADPPAAPPTAPTVPQANPLKQYLQTNDELLDTAPDHTEFLVPDLLTADELFMLFTGPRMGKSLLAMTLTKAVANGGTFLRRPVTQGTVIYVRMEDNPAKTKEREIAQGWTRGMPVIWLTKFGLSQTAHLRELVEEHDPRLVVIDTLSRANDTAVSESSSEIANLLSPLQDMASEFGCCVLLVHHSRKLTLDNTKDLDVFDNARGSTAIRATCRGAMAIAAGENCYRLFVENGWGKYDLRVQLNTSNLTWELLGSWAPQVDGDQRAAVLDYLAHNSPASIEEIHRDLGIPKKSLYTVLTRLQTSEVVGERVVKQGKRRAYTYALGDATTIQQLNNLLNRPNQDAAMDSADSTEKKEIFSSKDGVDRQILACSTSNTHAGDPLFDTSIPERSTPESSQNVDSDGDSPDTIHPSPQIADAPLSNKEGKTGENASGDKGSAILQPIQQLNIGGSSSTIQGVDRFGAVLRENDPPQRQRWIVEAQQPKVGSWCKYVGESERKQRVCGDKKLRIHSIENDIAQVQAENWAFPKPLPIADLVRVD